MKDKIAPICLIIIALCFISIAYSQRQMAVSKSRAAESLAILAVKEIAAARAAGRLSLYELDLRQAYELGWSIESSFLYAVGSKYATPETAKEVNAQKKKWAQALEKASKERENREAECFKRKNLPADASKEERLRANTLCFMEEFKSD